ncbi:SPFH/Band 7/PHB domain protein [Neisseria sicca ATCC 29256]|uniref:SPFH/Band 7/PHB domain protein n=1 Tax=Neisseria sicca ATCC 29256 TaxID=547045 RepID=C6M2V5_NEISI|nr:slipin family protein [Neisseria sicca]EET45219.1 SPFH/Band 7/PHB domain protein [Neisseria sicca ATCC 29256]QMT38598.1 slipin family protein [Neisseria sicca]
MFKNFVVKPTEHLIVLLDGSLHTVLNAGKHTIWHWGKEIETHKQDATVLHVQWNGIGSLLKIASERKKAEKFLQIVHNPAGHNTLVWHDEMPVFTITDNTDYWAFFRPEKGELNTLTLAHNEYWLPENVQETLLLRNQVPSNCEKFVVEQHERLLIRINGRLQRVLGEGRYLLQSKARAKNNEIEIERQHTANAMYHQWEDAQKWAKEQPENPQWLVLESPVGQNTLAWHQDFGAKVVASGEHAAFWLPENGEIETHTQPKTEYWLPENVQAALLAHITLDKPLQKYTVKANECLLITERNRLMRVLGEGDYVLLLGEEHKALFADTGIPVYENTAQLAQWAAQNPELAAAHWQRVEAGENELLLWSQNGKLQNLIRPKETAWFWREAAQPYEIQRIDLSQGLAIDADTVKQLQNINFGGHPVFKNAVHTVNVPEHHQGLVYIDNVQQPPLTQGRYHYWLVNQTVGSQVADLRLQTCEVSGQELLTEDKVTVRANVVCNYRITDAPKWFAQHQSPEEYLYRELQFAIRALIGSKSMDTLLADKQGLDTELTALIRAKVPLGAEIDSAGVKDIILPGEIRSILTRVVEAEKSAQANNIRRREETAATRSLLNTARVMEENPTALRLKELETLEKVTEKIDKISVYGGLDGVLKGLINIQQPK